MQRTRGGFAVRRGTLADADHPTVIRAHLRLPFWMTRVPSGTVPSAATGLATSKKDARRSMEKGAVKCDGVRVPSDGIVPDGTHVVQNGKRRWARITVG